MSAARTLLGLALALSIPATSRAQGLGDAAARERTKREKEAAEAGESKGAGGKVYSNEDLEHGRPPQDKKKSSAGSPSPAPAAPAAAPESSGSEVQRAPEPPPAPAPPEAPDTAALEARVKALQDKLNPMSGSFIYGAGGSNDANEEARVRSELQQVEAELAQARTQPSTPRAPAGDGSARESGGEPARY